MSEKLTYFKGTHRVIAPKKTIEINEDKLRIAGITRIADITDLWIELAFQSILPLDQPPKRVPSVFTVGKELHGIMRKHLQ